MELFSYLSKSLQFCRRSHFRFIAAAVCTFAWTLSSFANQNGSSSPHVSGGKTTKASSQSAPRARAGRWLEITPTTTTVPVGSARDFGAWDESGGRVTEAKWSLSDPNAGALLTSESSQESTGAMLGHAPYGTVRLVAKAIGQVTLTATCKNGSAQALIRVVPGPFLKGGASRWTVAAHPGFSTISFQRAEAMYDGPDIFSIESGGEGGLWVRGLDANGVQVWAHHLTERIGAAALEGSPAPVAAYLRPGTYAFIHPLSDNLGGAILQLEDSASHSLLVKLDAQTGEEVWRYASPGWLYRTSTLHPEGTLFIVEMRSTPKPETALIGIDVASGTVKSRLPFPLSQTGEKNVGCKEGNDRVLSRPSPAGAPMTSERGTVVLEVEVSSSIHDALPCNTAGVLSIDNSLRLLELKKDGTYAWKVVKQFTYKGPPGTPEAKAVPRAVACEVIPDGLGGVQAAWTLSIDYPTRKMEARITRISPTETKEFSLPFPGWGGTPWEPSDANMVLGEQTTGMASVGNLALAYDVVTGEVKWSWRAEQGRVQILMSVAGNGLLIMNRGDVVLLDASGKLAPEAQEFLRKRYGIPMSREEADNDQIDENGATAFEFDFSQFLAIQTARMPASPSALIAVAIEGRSD